MAGGKYIADTFCEECGIWVDLSPDIFGDASKDGRVVDGRLVCAACIERLEQLEVEA